MDSNPSSCKLVIIAKLTVYINTNKTLKVCYKQDKHVEINRISPISCKETNSTYLKSFTISKTNVKTSSFTKL